jgi:hypothetical protein
LIDEDARAGKAFDVFEKERGTAGLTGAAVKFRDAVGDLGDFEKRGDFFADAAKFAGFIQEFDPVSEVVAGQGGAPWLDSILTIERGSDGAS